MKRIQEWLLFSIQFVIKAGLLGKYRLVSTSTSEPDNKQGLKTLEKTILSLGKKNDTLNETITSVKYEIATLEKDILGFHRKLEYMTSQYTEAEKRVNDYFLENVSLKKDIEVWVARDFKWAESSQDDRVSFEKKIASLNSTLEQATILSERLQEEMKKWRT